MGKGRSRINGGSLQSLSESENFRFLGNIRVEFLLAKHDTGSSQTGLRGRLATLKHPSLTYKAIA